MIINYLHNLKTKKMSPIHHRVHSNTFSKNLSNIQNSKSFSLIGKKNASSNRQFKITLCGFKVYGSKSKSV